MASTSQNNKTNHSSQDDSQKTANTSSTQSATQPAPLLSDEEKSMIWGYLLPTSSKHSRVDFRRDKRLYTIGRIMPKGQANECDIQLNGLVISRKHCELIWNGDDGETATVIVVDTSRNGTFINNVMIGHGNREFLREGNYISFGPHPKESARNASTKSGEKLLEPEEYHRYEFHLTASEIPRNGLFKSYTLAHIIGNGAFATVMKGMHRQSGKMYAIKMIKNKPRPTVSPASTGGGESLVWSYQKFTGTSEFDIMQKLKHPNICELIEFFVEDNGDINLVLEYVNGGDLLTYMGNRGSGLNEDQIQHITHQICDAVAYIHAQGVAHRDLKPENILVTQDEPVQVKIADFGLAKMLVGETELRTRCGTKPFCAPEILLGVDKIYSLNVDSWSVGNIVYYMFVNHGAYNPECWRLDPTGIADPGMDWDSLESSNASAQAIDFVHRLLRLDPSKRMTLTESLGHGWFAYYEPPVKKAPFVPEEEKKPKPIHLVKLPDLSLSQIPGISPQKEDIIQASTAQHDPLTSKQEEQTQNPGMLTIENIDTEASLGSNLSDMSIKDGDNKEAETNPAEDVREESENRTKLKRGHSQVASSDSLGETEVATTSKALAATRPTVNRPVVRKKPRFDDSKAS